jgi:hypothetical protein
LAGAVLVRQRNITFGVTGSNRADNPSDVR